MGWSRSLPQGGVARAKILLRRDPRAPGGDGEDPPCVRKDRYALLSPPLLALLRAWWRLAREALPDQLDESKPFVDGELEDFRDLDITHSHRIPLGQAG